MFEYFTDIEPKERCILENSTNSIDAAILYLDNDKKIRQILNKMRLLLKNNNTI